MYSDRYYFLNTIDYLQWKAESLIQTLGAHCPYLRTVDQVVWDKIWIARFGWVGGWIVTLTKAELEVAEQRR